MGAVSLQSLTHIFSRNSTYFAQIYKCVFQTTHLTDLSQVDGEVDLVVLNPPGKGRALPPPLRAIDSVLGWVLAGVTIVTVLALDDFSERISKSVLRTGSGQSAIQLGSYNIHPARGTRVNPPLLGQVKIRWG